MDQDDRGTRKELGGAWGRKTIFRIYCIENQFSLIEKKKDELWVSIHVPLLPDYPNNVNYFLCSSHCVFPDMLG